MSSKATMTRDDVIAWLKDVPEGARFQFCHVDKSTLTARKSSKTRAKPHVAHTITAASSQLRENSVSGYGYGYLVLAYLANSITPEKEGN